jgi:plastocyanin
MRHMMRLLIGGLLTTGLFAACSSDSTTPTSPTGGGGTTGGGTSGGGTQAPTSAAVTLGDIFFRSDHNGTSNPAVDTVAVGGTVTWTWGSGANMPHSVQSLGSPSFTSSSIMTGSGNTHSATFGAAGTYQYDCAVHGQLMTGRIVVLDPGNSASSTPPPSMPTPSPSPTPGY